MIRPSLQSVWQKVVKGDSPLDAYYGAAPNKRPISYTTLLLMSVVGVGYFIALSVSLIIVGWFVTLPGLYANDTPTLYRRRFLALWWYAAMLINYLLIIVYGRHRDRIPRASTPNLLPVTAPRLDTPVSVDYCTHCQHHQPPRSKHCLICDHCVLKRDHHCFFTATCIGFHNQRFFVVFCLYASLGCYYSSYATLSYISCFHIPSSQWYTFIAPFTMLQWLLGNASFAALSLIFYLYFSVMTGVTCTYFFCQQIVFIIFGTTMHEFTTKSFAHRTNVREHLKSVFGPMWPLNFLFPMVCCKNKGTGRDWGLPKVF